MIFFILSIVKSKKIKNIFVKNVNYFTKLFFYVIVYFRVVVKNERLI